MSSGGVESHGIFGGFDPRFLETKNPEVAASHDPLVLTSHGAYKVVLSKEVGETEIKLEGNSREVSGTIDYDFEDSDGVVYGKESVERLEVIEKLKTSLSNQINFLIDKKSTLESGGASRKKIARLEKSVAIYTKMLENASNNLEDFIKSSFYRDEIGKILKANMDPIGVGYAKGINQISLGAPVNFRYQACASDNDKIGFFRLGVITDLRNGFTNLEELKRLAKDESLLNQKREELISEATAFLADNPVKLAAYGYALEQLAPKNLSQTIKERRAILGMQMLQLIEAQVSKNFDGIVDDPGLKAFDFSHLGLLNRKTRSLDPTGWMHDEANEMVDMAEIFKEFDGKKLIFDGKGPLIDSKGHVHLSQKLIDENGNARRLVLKSCFINVSVQGYNKNDGIQSEINDEGMKKILQIALRKAKKYPDDGDFKQGIDLLYKVQEELNAGRSTYVVAEDFSVALVKLKMPFSMGCLSAKDRTGYVGARTVFRFVEEKMVSHPKLKADKKLRNSLSKKFAISVLDKEGCAARVVDENTPGVRILKCSAMDLPGYSEGVVGKVRRLSYFLEQVSIHPSIQQFRKSLEKSPEETSYESDGNSTDDSDSSLDSL